MATQEIPKRDIWIVSLCLGFMFLGGGLFYLGQQYLPGIISFASEVTSGFDPTSQGTIGILALILGIVVIVFGMRYRP